MNNVRNLWCQETAAEERRIAHLTRFAARKQAERITTDGRRERRNEMWSTVWDLFWWAVVPSLIAVLAGSALGYAAEVATHGTQLVLSGL